jgi:2,3-diaminopropionate biosynthesis protein SbnB
MANNDILILTNADIEATLAGREMKILETISAAYQTHERGMSSLPHSLFLRFPDNARNRIIALPAFLGGDFNVAGVKWIASFPDNIDRGLERASAVVVLNSPLTGKPEAILEGSVISARRTAASAALAARTLGGDLGFTDGALIGCGLIGFEILRFLSAALPAARRFTIYDISAKRASLFRQRCKDAFPNIAIEIADSVEAALGSARLITISTTSIEPHISSLSVCQPDSLLLHLSLRDLTPQVILTCDNVVDDVDHVCQANTSVHLAEHLTGNRDFIRCTLAEVLLGSAPARPQGAITVFSPFGLGVLDLALARLLRDLAASQGRGTTIKSFLPESWNC